LSDTFSKAIFGVGVILSTFISIYVTSIAQDNHKIQGTTVTSTLAQSPGVSTTPTTNSSSGNTQSAVTSIMIAEGSAAQQVKLYYQPNPATVSSGSRVTWTNKDIAPHTATSGLSSSAEDSGKIFDTGLISPGSTGSAVVGGNGKIPYHCTFHPWMTGVTQVSASNQTMAIGSLQNTTSSATSQPTRMITLPTVNDSNLMVAQVISNLSMPTMIAFLGPDDFLMLQKGGTVFRVTNGTLSSHPLLNVSVGTGMTQGMLGVAVSKNSEFNATYVFLYYTESLKNQTNVQNETGVFEPLENRLYRYELVDDKLVNPKLLTALPAKQGYMDNGGYLKIGPDNNVYFSVGAITASDVSAIQTLTQNFVNGTPVDGRAGILRVTQDGIPVLSKDDHGLLGDSSPLNLYYGYGLKDSFGIDFDPLTGNLWDAEPGRIISDEINLIEPGFNGGFEALQGPSTFVPAAPADLVYFNGTGKYRDPEFVWTQKVVPVGLKFLTSDKLGEKYENDIFVGSFLNGKIYHFDLNENRTHLIVPAPFVYKQMATWNSTGSEDITFADGFGGISSLNVGPDGYLYVISLFTAQSTKSCPLSSVNYGERFLSHRVNYTLDKVRTL